MSDTQDLNTENTTDEKNIPLSIGADLVANLNKNVEVEEQKTEEPKISIDQFKTIEIKIGKILSVEIIPDADKLLKLKVDMGEENPRQILSGIKMYFEDPQSLVGKSVPFVSNLTPRTIRGLESNGMILAVNDKDGAGFSLLEVGDNISAGSIVG